MNWKAVLWILATVICDICALYFGYATLWVLGFFLTLVLLFAFVMILFSFWHLSFQQVLSRSAVEKHEEAQLLVQCQNNGFLFYPTVWLHYISGERKQISAYPGEQEQKVGYIFPMKGIYPVGVKKIVVYEPFGIFCRRIRIKEPQKLFVLPRTIPLQETPMMDTGKSSEEGKRKKRAVDRSIVSGLREYEYGDTLNSINWKATAKRNEVIVNCYENEFCIKAFVYVDRFQMPEQPAVAALLEDAACDHAIT